VVAILFQNRFQKMMIAMRLGKQIRAQNSNATVLGDKVLDHEKNDETPAKLPMIRNSSKQKAALRYGSNRSCRKDISDVAKKFTAFSSPIPLNLPSNNNVSMKIILKPSSTSNNTRI